MRKYWVALVLILVLLSIGVVVSAEEKLEAKAVIGSQITVEGKLKLYTGYGIVTLYNAVEIGKSDGTVVNQQELVVLPRPAKKLDKKIVRVKGVLVQNGNEVTLQREYGLKDATVKACAKGTSITLNKKTARVAADSILQLKATVKPASALQAVRWSSNKTSVATVDETGLVKIVGGGKAVITAKTADGKLKATCKVTVVVKVSQVNLSETSVTMKVGETKKLTATVLPADASDKTITWTVYNDPAGAVSISSSGVVTAKKKGIGIVSATTKDGVVGVCAVNVGNVDVKIESIYISEKDYDPYMTVGAQQQLKIRTSPFGVKIPELTWESSNPSVATVDQNMMVTTKAPGVAVIFAKWSLTPDGQFASYDWPKAIIIVTQQPILNNIVPPKGTEELAIVLADGTVITPAMTYDAAIAAFPDAHKYEGANEHSIYPSDGIAIYFNATTKKFLSGSVYYGGTAQSYRGIKVGDSAEDLLLKYGKAKLPYELQASYSQDTGMWNVSTSWTIGKDSLRFSLVETTGQVGEFSLSTSAN